MKKVTVIIERSKDAFWAYSNDLEGITGAGASAEDVKKSIEEAIEIQQELGNIPNTKFKVVYKFDTESLLSYYKNFFSAPAMQKWRESMKSKSIIICLG